MGIERLSKVFRFEEIDSTNARAKEAGNQGESTDTLFVADRQTAGSGRRGRTWESPAGENIYMSILLKPEIEVSKAPMLTLVMAMAVAKGLEEHFCESSEEHFLESEVKLPRPQIKWPNDIILNKKKVCGILTEMGLDDSKIKYVVIGVGINVNQKVFVPELEEKATSLALEMGIQLDRELIIEAVVGKFYEYYDKFLETGDLSYLQKTYNQMLVNRGCNVVVHEPGKEYEALAVGIDEKGELVVEAADGTRQNIYAGEVSVRGINGYV